MAMSSDAEEVKSKIDIVDFIQKYVPLKKLEQHMMQVVVQLMQKIMYRTIPKIKDVNHNASIVLIHILRFLNFLDIKIKPKTSVTPPRMLWIIDAFVARVKVLEGFPRRLTREGPIMAIIGTSFMRTRAVIYLWCIFIFFFFARIAPIMMAVISII